MLLCIAATDAQMRASSDDNLKIMRSSFLMFVAKSSFASRLGQFFIKSDEAFTL
jgi:hypothetical protein